MPEHTVAPPPPRPITTRVHHEKIIEVFGRLPRGKVLDAACGEGALTVKLEAMGFEVRCTDIQPGLSRMPGKEVRRADLNQSLPYEDASFDTVACINVLHRLYAVDRAVAEIARVLRPGGLAVLSFPNYASIVRRIRFLCSGTISKAVTTQDTIRVVDDPEANFRNCLLFPQVARALERHGLAVESLENDRRKKGVLLLAPLACFLAGLYRIFSSREKRERLLLRFANHPRVLLGGPHLVILARKPGPPAGLPSGK